MPPSIGTAINAIVESGSVKARGGKPPCFPRASGSTQQKVQIRVVMEKKNRRTSTIRNHSPSHDELTMRRNGMARAVVPAAHRLRDQSSQAMAVAGEFMSIPAPYREERRRHFYGQFAALELIANGLGKLRGFLDAQEALGAGYDPLIQLRGFVHEPIQALLRKDFGQPIHVEIHLVVEIVSEGELLPLLHHGLKEGCLLLGREG